MDETLKAGDRVYVVKGTERRFHETFEARVTGVGRKWATLKSDREGGSYPIGRCHKETLAWDDGGFYADTKVYRSKEQYDQQQRISRLWAEFRKQVSSTYQTPLDLAEKDIYAAANALKLNITERARETNP